MSRPNLFLVGAPKFGTTSMYRYLEKHPAIFMSPTKEPYFFLRDLARDGRLTDEQEYLALFKGARDERWIGEGSTLYLCSRTAARDIREFNPSARILIMLRDPVDLMYSLHAQYLYTGQEDVLDFEEALSLEEVRRRGQRIPIGCKFLEGLQYRQMVDFPPQLQRYWDAFGRERVRVMLFDDFKRDPLAVYAETLEFLEVDPSFRPFPGIYNAAKRIPNLALRRIQRKYLAGPSGWLSANLPEPIVRFVRAGLRRFPQRQRPGLRAELRRELVQELEPMIASVGELLGRDLSGWTRCDDEVS